MIDEDVIFGVENDAASKTRRMVLGVSGASLSLIDMLAQHCSVPTDTTIFDRVFERNHIGKWCVESLLELFKDAVDEIEVALTVNYGGVVLNYTPIDAISLLLLHLSKATLSDKEKAEVDTIVNQALGLCPRFTHFIQVFPSAKEKTISTDLLANLKAGVYNRYYERLGCVVIQVAEILSNDKDRLDFIKRVMEVLG